MAVKKGILDKFLTPSSPYRDNKKDLKAIFISTEEEEREEANNFLETVLLNKNSPKTPSNSSSPMENSSIGTQKEHNWNTIGTQINPVSDIEHIDLYNNLLLEAQALEHKRDTIGTQLEHKNLIKRGFGTQKEHKRNTKGTQKEHKTEGIGTQLEHVKEHTLGHNWNTIGTQLEHKTGKSNSLSYLVGIQKHILFFIYNSCKKTRSHSTEEFSLQNLANALKVKPGSIKTSLRRLEEKQFIKSVHFKKGRGGWTKFMLPDGIYRDLLEIEKEHNWNTNGTQMEHKWNTQKDTQKDTNALSSSSFKNTTTTIEKQVIEKWNFDIHAYRRFGFTETQLHQLKILGTISAEEVEQSLIEFSFDLDNNKLPPIKTGKINFLMGLLRSGHSYVSEGFKNEQEAMIEEMARRREVKKKNLLNEEYEAWMEGLSTDQKKDIQEALPPHLLAPYRMSGVYHPDLKKWLWDYFISHIKK